MDNIYLVSNATGKRLKFTVRDINHLSSKINGLKKGATLSIYGHNIDLRPYDLSHYRYMERFTPWALFDMAANMQHASRDDIAAAYDVLYKIYSPLNWTCSIYRQAGGISFTKAIELIDGTRKSFEGIYMDNLAVFYTRNDGTSRALNARYFYCKNMDLSNTYINGVPIYRLNELQDKAFTERQKNIIKFIFKRRALINA